MPTTPDDENTKQPSSASAGNGTDDELRQKIINVTCPEFAGELAYDGMNEIAQKEIDLIMQVIADQRRRDAAAIKAKLEDTPIYGNDLIEAFDAVDAVLLNGENHDKDNL